jgi:ABC transporter substrate binding protein
MAKDHENDEAMTGRPDCVCGQALDFPSQSTCAAWLFANVPVRSQGSKRKTEASWEVIHITSIGDGRSKVVNEFLRDHETLVDPFDHVPIFADKILHGAKPADLPVELPTRSELLINQKTAKALGIAVPTSLLVSADELVEQDHLCCPALCRLMARRVISRKGNTSIAFGAKQT